MRAPKLLLATLSLCVILSSPMLADTRKDNIDVIIALDKSLSMERKVVAVKEWVNSFIIDQLLISGDYLVVVAFYGKTDVTISQSVGDDAAKKSLKRKILQIRGNGRFTDIGNVLDVVKSKIATRENDGREKYVLLLTDGIQEAPPSSKYYSKDGKFNHEFLANTKTIQQKGWKVMILGIGTETAAKDLARELQSSYTEITSKLSVDTLTEKTGALFGAVTVEGPVRVGAVSGDGASRLSFSLKTSGLQGDANITLSGIAARIGSRDIVNLLASPYSFSVKKDATTPVAVSVKFPTDLPQGSTTGTLVFSFSSAQRFTPAEAGVTIVVKNWIQNNLLLVIGAIIVLLILAALIFLLIWRLTRGKPIRFAVVIDDTPIDESPASLSTGHELFLNDTFGAFSLVARRNAKSIARFTVKDAKLLLAVLKQDRFPKLKEVPPDARGRTFALRAENGKNLSMKIQPKERKK